MGTPISSGHISTNHISPAQANTNESGHISTADLPPWDRIEIQLKHLQERFDSLSRALQTHPKELVTVNVKFMSSQRVRRHSGATTISQLIEQLGLSQRGIVAKDSRGIELGGELRLMDLMESVDSTLDLELVSSIA